MRDRRGEEEPFGWSADKQVCRRGRITPRGTAAAANAALAEASPSQRPRHPYRRTALPNRDRSMVCTHRLYKSGEAMMRIFAWSAHLLPMLFLCCPPALAEDAANIVCSVIRGEVDQYLSSGETCPCPYHLASNGSSCGGRSAWARRHGSSPRCFADTADSAVRPLERTASLRPWPEPPACPVQPSETVATLPRISETRTASLPNSE